MYYDNIRYKNQVVTDVKLNQYCNGSVSNQTLFLLKYTQ